MTAEAREPLCEICSRGTTYTFIYIQRSVCFIAFPLMNDVPSTAVPSAESGSQKASAAGADAAGAGAAATGAGAGATGAAGSGATCGWGTAAAAAGSHPALAADRHLPAAALKCSPSGQLSFNPNSGRHSEYAEQSFGSGTLSVTPGTPCAGQSLVPEKLKDDTTEAQMA